MYNSQGAMNSIADDLIQLKLSAAGGYSPGGSRKTAPTVPPKPRKGQEVGSHISGVMCPEESI